MYIERTVSMTTIGRLMYAYNIKWRILYKNVIFFQHIFVGQNSELVSLCFSPPPLPPASPSFPGPARRSGRVRLWPRLPAPPIMVAGAGAERHHNLTTVAELRLAHLSVHLLTTQS